jgi:hypothetical protein
VGSGHGDSSDLKIALKFSGLSIVVAEIEASLRNCPRLHNSPDRSVVFVKRLDIGIHRGQMGDV